MCIQTSQTCKLSNIASIGYLANKISSTLLLIQSQMELSYGIWQVIPSLCVHSRFRHCVPTITILLPDSQNTSVGFYVRKVMRILNNTTPE